MNPLHAALADLELAPEVAFENLTMVPLLAKRDPASRRRDPGYLLLDDALASGAAEITEISERGSVPELRKEGESGQSVAAG